MKPARLVVFILALATGISPMLAQINSGTSKEADNGKKVNEAPPPQPIDTRIGELNYENNYPTNETVIKLYDEMDFQRACQAYFGPSPS